MNCGPCWLSRDGRNRCDGQDGRVPEPNLLDSLLSRSRGTGPLEERAAELHAVLLEKGWTERKDVE